MRKNVMNECYAGQSVFELVLLFSICKFEIDQQHTQRADDAVANNDREQVEAIAVDKPDKCTAKNNQHHGQA
jgi:hypothetical protein